MFEIMTDCRDNCPIPNGGECPKHGILKSAQWVQLCITRENYWKAWNENRGPKQAMPKHVPAVAQSGPGTELKKLFRSWGLRACGSCVETAKKMNENGVEWCREHVDELADEIHKNAEQRGWTSLLSTAATLVGVEGPVVRWAIREACDRAEKKPEFSVPVEEFHAT